jgi:signal transduction histidine kinase
VAPRLAGLLSRPWVVDTVVAVVALATELPGYWSAGWVVTVGELVVAAAIALRRLAPFAAAGAFGLAFTAQSMAAADPPSDQLALIAVVTLCYTFGSVFGWSRSVAGLLLVFAGGAAHELWNSHDYAFVAGVTLVGWIPGIAVRFRQREVVTLRAQAAVLVREQALGEQAAVVAERNRLARELHDVLSHSVSAMVIQAAAAEQVLPVDPEAARAALVRVQSTGHEAIAELHRLLGVLRMDDEPAARAPVPDLDAVVALVEHAQAAGQRVRLELTGQRPLLPDTLELSAYRIVQESLTNAQRYAPGAPVHVRIVCGPDQLEVEVRDEGGAAPQPPLGGGRGLLGLRERAALFGGTLSAGPDGNGFVVRARLPFLAGPVAP